MKVILGADHGGYEVKQALKTKLQAQGHEVVDLGNSILDENDDYVDFAQWVAMGVVAAPNSRGVLLCRNGMGMSIVANRFKGIRCGLAFNTETARRGRADDDINILSLPADYITQQQAEEIVEVFLNEKFGGEDRFVRRIKKIDSI